MFTDDLSNVKPLFNERVDDFTMAFNAGGKLELLKWQKDVKLQL